MQLIQLLIDGIASGCIYGLVALGFVLIYKATETINFAQGDILMLGAFVAYSLIGILGMDYLTGFALTVLIIAVFGFFLDAKERQQPMIMGSLPGIPQYSADPTKGFNDPRSPFSEQPAYAGTPTYGPYPVDGDDYDMPSGHDLGEPDTNRLARNDANNAHGVIASKNSGRSLSVPTPAYISSAGKSVLATP